MSTTLSSETMLRIYHGAGRIHEVPAEAVRGARGSTLDVLRRLAADRIHDPELIRTLHSSGLVIQAFHEGEGEVHQQPVPPDTDFTRFSSLLDQHTVELSASVRHVGGC